jgi:CHAD domain-containing protein
MSFQFKPDESVKRGVRRMARKELDKAIEELTGQPGASRDEVVHDARKRCKKLRGLLRLVRDGLGDAQYREENFCLRDAARPLTEVRDAKVLAGVLDKLAEHFAGQVRPGRMAHARAALKVRRQKIAHRVLDREAAFADVAALLRAARGRVKQWDVGPDDWSALQSGLKRVYRGGRCAYAAAAEEPNTEKLHELQKQAKYLRHQLETLQPIWPGVLDNLVEQAHRLGDLLGDDHDLAVLRGLLQEQPDMTGDGATQEMLVALIDRRRAELQEEAFRLGRRFYADRPGAFLERLHQCWEAWRAELPAAL